MEKGQQAARRTTDRSFPAAGDVDHGRRALVEERKAQFLRLYPEPEDTADYLAKYQHIFSAEGFPYADPLDLKAFANSRVGARVGNMSVFNTEWNRLGPERAAERVRKVIGYLLHPERPAPIEDRLNDLLARRAPVEMKGLKEAILTKVLCVAHPEDYVRFLVYTSSSGKAGKREVARQVWGLELPSPRDSDLTIGQLIKRSNDLLIELAGDGFKNRQHASDFIWWSIGGEL